ncbi:MAG: PKD domain-containing protein, partial [Bacteroidota bacterium]
PVSHTYTGSGNFTVTLIVEDSIGCRDTLSKPQYIQINPPTADFTQDVTSGCPPLTVTFTDNSNAPNPIVNYDWDFGDGNTGTGSPVVHTYNTPGIYTVTLIITDSIGCMDTIVKPNLITVDEPPTANIGITDTLACDPFTIQLTDSSTSTASNIVAWSWDFGDGNTSNLQNPTNGYQNPGPYVITLIVTDANGCMDTTTMPFVVPVRPDAFFTANDSAGCAPFDVLFTADSTDIISWQWDFGDGNDTMAGPVISHLYEDRGTYTVSLIIEDIYGCMDTFVRPNYIFVDSLDADFILNSNVGCPPLPVIFTDQSYSDTTIVSWDWDFGDGGTSNLQNPSHVYSMEGTYTITLIVTNAIGCTDTATFDNLEVLSADPPGVPPILMVTVLNDVSDSIA